MRRRTSTLAIQVHWGRFRREPSRQTAAKFVIATAMCIYAAVRPQWAPRWMTPLVRRPPECSHDETYSWCDRTVCAACGEVINYNGIAIGPPPELADDEECPE